MEETSQDLNSAEIIDQNLHQGTRGSSAKKIIYIAIMLVLLIVALGIFIIPEDDEAGLIAELVEKKTESAGSEISPTPFPFQELTIPYLRSQIYESNLSELEEVAGSASYTSHLTSYKSDGLEINGLLTMPVGDVPDGGWPGIVFLHGYIPPATYSTLGPQYTDYVDYLARSGFVVFKIDLRGHGESEGIPGGAYFSADYITDTLNAYSALQNADFVNPEKIGLWGHSMAGNVVLRSLAVKPDIPAVVIWSGAVYTYADMRKYGIQDNSYQRPPEDSQRSRERDRLRGVHGDPAGGGEFWKMVAPTNYLSDVSGAIQINHAINDNVVDIGYSRDLNSILDDTSIIHELNEYPTGGHNITGVSFINAMDNTVEFFDKYLNKE